MRPIRGPREDELALWQTYVQAKVPPLFGFEFKGRESQLGLTIHLFVRARAKEGGKTAGFVYCGPVEFQRWEGEKPITVWWRLAGAVPEPLRALLRVAGPGPI